MTYGRFQVPTRGHINHINTLMQYAKQHNADTKVYISNKETVLPVQQRIDIIKKQIPTLDITPQVNPFNAVLEQIHQGYSDIVLAMGGDYTQQHSLVQAVQQYAQDHNVKLTFLPTGPRHEHISGTQLMQATTLQQFQQIYCDDETASEVYEQINNNAG